MSAASVKISPALKQLIALPRAKGSSIPSPGSRALTDLFGKIARKGEEKGGVGKETWLTLCTAGVMTVNSPESLCGLYEFAGKGAVHAAVSFGDAYSVSTEVPCWGEMDRQRMQE